METGLWSDKKFIEKRLCEQEEYGRQLDTRLKMNEITQERYDLLNDSYVGVWERFNKRFIELIVM